MTVKMRHGLKRHPDSRCAAVTAIDVEAARPRPGALSLRYIVTGAIGDLRLPSAGPSVRADALWQHTCFEAFVRGASQSSYYEFNFAPSRAWAAYGFERYRSGMRIADEIGTPALALTTQGGRLMLEVSLDLPTLPGDVAWHLGLSAVIEQKNGRNSYWALAHPPGKPDFHHADGFVLELPTARHDAT